MFDPAINAFSIVTRIFPGPLFIREAELQVPQNAQTPVAAEIGMESPACDGQIQCSLDFLKEDGEEWTIAIRTAAGRQIELREGGKRLFVDGAEQPAEGPGEYPDLYRSFADLIDCRQSLVDVEPLRLVGDCLLVGERTEVAPITV